MIVLMLREVKVMLEAAGYFAVEETSDVAAVVFPVVAVNASESALAEKQGLALLT